MINQGLAQLVLEKAMSTGGDFAEIFLEDRINNNISVRSSLCETISSSRIHGAGIRVYLGLISYYVYTNDTTENGLIECATKVAGFVNNDKKYAVAKLETLKTYKPYDILMKPNEVEAKQKINLLKNMDKAARTEEEISQVLINYADSVQNVWIANTEGRFVSDTRTYSRIRCSAVAGKGGETQTASESPGACRGFEMFVNMDTETIAKKVAKSAVKILHAPHCPAGKMPVVIGNGFGGVIFHEACGHSLEATSVAVNHSEFCGKLGQKIAADCVTAYDDGTIANQWGSLNVDDEGTPTTKLMLIENGILKNYMIDRLNNRRINMELTGSARRESYQFEPTSRMRNTYIANGKDKEEEMIATMGDGLYAKKMGGGSVNPTTGEFNFNVEEAYLIKDGKITNPVRGASLIGKGGEVLMAIDRVADNFDAAQGMCGSLSGSVPTDVGQPSIRVKEMTVGGMSE